MTSDVDISTPFDTESDYKKHSTAHLVNHDDPKNTAKLAESIFFQKLIKALDIKEDADMDHHTGFAFKGWQRLKTIAPLFSQHLLLVTPIIRRMLALGEAEMDPKAVLDILLVEIRLRELRPIE